MTTATSTTNSRLHDNYEIFYNTPNGNRGHRIGTYETAWDVANALRGFIREYRYYTVCKAEDDYGSKGTRGDEWLTAYEADCADGYAPDFSDIPWAAPGDGGFIDLDANGAMLPDVEPPADPYNDDTDMDDDRDYSEFYEMNTVADLSYDGADSIVSVDMTDTLDTEAALIARAKCLIEQRDAAYASLNYPLWRLCFVALADMTAWYVWQAERLIAAEKAPATGESAA